MHKRALSSLCHVRKTIKLLRLACFVLISIAGLGNAVAQGFINLGFENTTITPLPGGDRYTATIPGWSWNTFNFLTGESNTVVLNNITLDAPAVTLHGANSPFFPAVRGSYSVVLQGGTTAGGMFYGTNGASIFQTGQVLSLHNP